MAGYIVPEIEDKGLNGSDIAVWAALCRFAQWDYIDGEPAKSKDGSCYPSIELIADKAHVKRGTVFNSLKHLEELGYITRARYGHGASYNLFAENYRQTSKICTSNVQNLDVQDGQKFNNCTLKVQNLDVQNSKSSKFGHKQYI